MARYLLLLLFLSSFISADAQLLQRIKGQVTDKESNIPLEGVVVAVTSLPEPRLASTDANGRFVLDSIPVGKQKLVFSYGAFKPYTLTDIFVTSGWVAVM